MVNVDLEFYDPSGIDFHGLKALLRSLLDGDDFHGCSDLVEAIIRQVPLRLGQENVFPAQDCSSDRIAHAEKRWDSGEDSRDR